MALRAVPQMALDETTVEDKNLEAALELRQRSKIEAGEATREYRKADEAAKVLVGALELDEGPVRIGRFRITKAILKGRTVSFETQPKDRIQIALVEDDD